MHDPITVLPLLTVFKFCAATAPLTWGDSVNFLNPSRPLDKTYRRCIFLERLRVYHLPLVRIRFFSPVFLWKLSFEER